jgi:hypothetical protein
MKPRITSIDFENLKSSRKAAEEAGQRIDAIRKAAKLCTCTDRIDYECPVCHPSGCKCRVCV